MPEHEGANLESAEVKIWQVKQSIDRLLSSIRNNEGTFASIEPDIKEGLIGEIIETKNRLDTTYDKQDATEEVRYLLNEYGAYDPDEIMKEAGFDNEF